MALDRTKMMELIAKEFPGLYLRTTEEFHSEKEGEGIWCCSVEDRITSKGNLIFSYYNETPKKYHNGVLKQFEMLLDMYGWYSEWNDPGTIMFYPC
jgi:hypothetical protein